MIIATLLALMFFGGSGATLMTDNIDRLHDSIKSELSKGSVRDAAMDVADKMKDTNKDYGKADGKAEKVLLKLIEDHDTTTAELQNHMAETNERRAEYQLAMLDLRSDLKRAVTADQWKKLFTAQGAK